MSIPKQNTWSQYSGKPSQYITNTKANSALHPSGVGKPSTGLLGWGYRESHLCQVPGNTVWSHTAGDTL